MIYFQNSNLASSQRFVTLLNFLVSQSYIVRSNISLKLLHIMHDCCTPIQRNFQYCHISFFLIVLNKNVVLPPFSSGCRSLRKSSTIMSSFAGLSCASLIATPLPASYSLPSTNCPLPTNQGNLEDLSTTTVEPSFLPLGCICKLFLMLPLSSINTISIFCNLK